MKKELLQLTHNELKEYLYNKNYATKAELEDDEHVEGLARHIGIVWNDETEKWEKEHYYNME